ncbi:MAG: hypothetical protein VX320_06790 [Candidatus Thermoplasmatota archaeon]|nr:hypothetical protein [Candidatus Thermoplasmatota archaeon]
MQGFAHVGGHVTLIFSIHDDSENLLEQGSRGAGLSLDHGIQITATANPGSGEISVTGTSPNQAIHQSVMKELSTFIPEVMTYDWTVEQHTMLPISQGFGLSAAGAISCALAIQRALELPEEKSRSLAIHIAHRIERQLSGGLGDVAALYAGGVELRLEPGCPPLGNELGGSGAVVSWFQEIPAVVCWRQTASRHTSTYIDDGDWKLAIRAAGEHTLSGLREGIWESARWNELLTASAAFAERSGLLDDAQRVDLLHMVGGALITSGLVDSDLAVRLCMLGESAIIVPSNLTGEFPIEWQENLVQALNNRGLGALAVSLADDALNLHSLS